MSKLAAHYDKNTAREWQRLQRHRTEFAVTSLALADYLPPAPARILDIGGGSGRYSLALAAKGYEMLLLDLSAGNLAWARREALAGGLPVRCFVQGDATALPTLPTLPFDVVLLLGPLYHLLTAEKRQKAVQEAYRVLKPGGLIFAAFVTRFAPLRDTAIKDPDWIITKSATHQQIVKTGIYPASPDGNPDFYFAHPDEVLPLMESASFAKLQLIGVEGVVAGHEEKINTVTGETWESWVELNYQLGHEPTLYGAADHLLYIGRKVGRK